MPDDLDARGDFGLYGVTETYFTADSVPLQIVAENPDRVSVIFSNPSIADMYFSTRSDLALLRGLGLKGPTSEVIYLDWQRHRRLVQQRWFVLSSTAGAVATVIESVVQYGLASQRLSATPDTRQDQLLRQLQALVLPIRERQSLLYRCRVWPLVNGGVYGASR